ncbi:MAG TPA: hypothetical protein VGJ05_04420 [Fimbriiglobus sp.]
MIRTFERSGVRFQYPGNWSVETEDTGLGWAATLTSPDTALLVAALRPEAASPAELAAEALAVMKLEYRELDAEPAVESIAGRPAVGHDVDFLTLDTTAVCRIRALDAPAGPLLLLSQCTQFDRVRLDPVLRAVVASLQLSEA